MRRRIAVVLLLVLVLAQGSALACAVHCAAMRHAQHQADACCAAMQPSTQPAVQAATQRIGQLNLRAAGAATSPAVATLRPRCTGGMLAAQWRKARPAPQQSARMSIDSAQPALAPASLPSVRLQGREARIPMTRSIPLRI